MTEQNSPDESWKTHLSVSDRGCANLTQWIRGSKYQWKTSQQRRPKEFWEWEHAEQKISNGLYTASVEFQADRAKDEWFEQNQECEHLTMYRRRQTALNQRRTLAVTCWRERQFWLDHDSILLLNRSYRTILPRWDKSDICWHWFSTGTSYKVQEKNADWGAGRKSQVSKKIIDPNEQFSIGQNWSKDGVHRMLENKDRI